MRTAMITMADGTQIGPVTLIGHEQDSVDSVAYRDDATGIADTVAWEDIHTMTVVETTEVAPGMVAITFDAYAVAPLVDETPDTDAMPVATDALADTGVTAVDTVPMFGPFSLN